MHSYNFELPVDPVPLLAMVKDMIEANGGTVTGQVPSMGMSINTPVGEVAGACHLLGGYTVNLVVTKKPSFLTHSMVRDQLVGYITEAVKLYTLQGQPAS